MGAQCVRCLAVSCACVHVCVDVRVWSVHVCTARTCVEYVDVERAQCVRSVWSAWSVCVHSRCVHIYMTHVGLVPIVWSHMLVHCVHNGLLPIVCAGQRPITHSCMPIRPIGNGHSGEPIGIGANQSGQSVSASGQSVSPLPQSRLAIPVSQSRQANRHSGNRFAQVNRLYRCWAILGRPTCPLG